MESVQPNNCIALKELKHLIETKQQQVKILDVRSKEEYEESHIPGAINIAILEIELASKLFDKSDFVITACGKGGGRSTQAAEKLQEFGFKYATWLCGGTFGWFEN
ncbi:MAG: rhodanese-like domain-containing protein [Bacteroidetes bacterium]|nr:rhodanese-like domain-containing protein [Bacteroidota bacterium]